MKRILILAGAVLLPMAAGAAEGPKGNHLFHLARRVADTEKERDLPSRAVWLSNRAIQSSKEIAKKSPAQQQSGGTNTEKN